MDLVAYAQIPDFSALMEKNGINIPRLRGYRLMSEEKAIPEEEIEKNARQVYKEILNLLTPTTHFRCLKFDGSPYDKREVKGRARAGYKRYVKQMKTFNSYVGREDVMLVHARIGSGNWTYYGGPLIAMEPWFIEKRDDGFDETYCDIYVKIRRD